MAIRDILVFPHPNLRKKAAPVETFDEALRTLVADMFETMYDAPGIGLAATQIDVHQRVIVIDVSEDKSEPMVFINPELLEQDGMNTHEEGCLSVPGFYETVERPEKIRVKAFDEHGKEFELETDGLLATCVQHEIDHLNGKVFVDYVSALKRDRIRKKLEKQQRKAG
ncbi:peptide deformylase [Granulosicoccaceae sp. 1_MG-2023]|nr:peptide deformylase [Granulosicoccaceae sp. 1_MG-2023]